MNTAKNLRSLNRYQKTGLPHPLLEEAAVEIERATARIEQLSEALEPFAEVARRLGWDKLDADHPTFNEHVLEAPADDIAKGAFYCLQVSEFVDAYRAFCDEQKKDT